MIVPFAMLGACRPERRMTNIAPLPPPPATTRPLGDVPLPRQAPRSPRPTDLRAAPLALGHWLDTLNMPRLDSDEGRELAALHPMGMDRHRLRLDLASTCRGEGGLPLRPLGSGRVGCSGCLVSPGHPPGSAGGRTPGSRLVATRAARVRPPRALAGVGVWTGSNFTGLSRVRVARGSGLHRARGQPVRGSLDASRLGAGAARGGARRVGGSYRGGFIRRRAARAGCIPDASQQRLPRRQRLSRSGFRGGRNTFRSGGGFRRQRRAALPKQRRQRLPKRWVLPRWRSLPRGGFHASLAAAKAPSLFARLQTLLRPQTLLQRREMSGENDAPRCTSFPDSVDRLFRRPDLVLLRVDCGIRVRESWSLEPMDRALPSAPQPSQVGRAPGQSGPVVCQMSVSHDHGTLPEEFLTSIPT